MLCILAKFIDVCYRFKQKRGRHYVIPLVRYTTGADLLKVAFRKCGEIR